MVEKRAYARLGLAGNPSDIFGGCVIACCITNFYTSVALEESPQLEIVRNEIHDPVRFESLRELGINAQRYGYYGMIRLVYATCKRFNDYCTERDITLDSRSCSIKYGTNIPRQVGLGGSSALVAALWSALMEFYGLTDDDIPLHAQPSLVLSVETKELEINAGLQDRVVQVYGGTMYMNFDESIVDLRGYGVYGRVGSDLLPRLFLACMECPGKTSGRSHEKVRFRYERGDKEVVGAMTTFANFARTARQALEEGDHERFGALMDMNFDLRRKIYGDEAIGEGNLQMIEIGRSLDAPVKFPGSGGAVVGMYRDSDQCDRLREEYQSAGFNFAEVTVQERPVDFPEVVGQRG